MSAILAPAMSESPTGTVESTLSSATSGPSSTLPPPLIKNLSNIQQLSRSNSIGSFTTTSATPQTLQQTPLQLLQKKVSMTSVGGSNLSRQQSFSVPNLDQGVVGPPASVHQPSGLSQGQPLVPHMYRADSERDETASADGPRGFPKESRISAEFFQETLDSVADLLRPSARGMSGSGSNLGVGGGRDLFFRPASFQLDPSLKPSDVGFSALSIAELATMGAEESGEVLESRHNLEGGRPRSEHGGKREGFVGHARTPAARLETNLSASDLLMGSSIGGSYAPTFAMDSSFLAQAMSSDDADEAYAVHHQPIQRPSQPLQRQDSGQRLSSTSPVGPIEKSRLSTTSTISSNMRNSINLDKDFDMYGSGVRPRTSSLSSNNSFRKSLEIMGTRTSPYAESFSRPLSTISSPGIDQPSSTTSETPDHRAPHQHHQTHATNQSCPAAWRSVGSLSDGPATTSTNTAPSMPGRSPTHGTTTYPRSTPQQPTHTRRQSEGGVTTKAIPLTTALTASSSSSISPQIETPQRPRLGPFWLSQEKHTSLQSTMDPPFSPSSSSPSARQKTFKTLKA
ncbi:hypothetical protein BC829DRAFT_54466 [Chytridium lagenaria]|nr:hypothetical protein BC829DRAFT_54466 [Chytridium lagenaria]